jgi:hypothetical protein
MRYYSHSYDSNYIFCKKCKCLIDNIKLQKSESHINECILEGNSEDWNSCNCTYYTEYTILFTNKPDIEWLKILYG